MRHTRVVVLPSLSVIAPGRRADQRSRRSDRRFGLALGPALGLAFARGSTGPPVRRKGSISRPTRRLRNMSDRVQGREIGNMAAVPGPPDVRSRSAGSQPGNGRVQLQRPGGRRATVRDALDAALHGIRLGGRDRRFLNRLVHWDKREAAAVASLLWQARVAGRCEMALSSRQLEIVLAALEDAAIYRT